jgi:polyphenol oxidase
VVAAAWDGLRRASLDAIQPDGTGKWQFDLWTANRKVLVSAGLQPTNIAVAAVDTADPHFFSDRAVRPCGRFAAIAALRPL